MIGRAFAFCSVWDLDLVLIDLSRRKIMSVDAEISPDNNGDKHEPDKRKRMRQGREETSKPSY